MFRTTSLILMFSLLSAACSGSGVSQAEYDQRVAELTLAQQELVAERANLAAIADELAAIDPEGLYDQIAVLEAEVEQRDALAASLIEELGGTVTEGGSALEQLAEELVGAGPVEDVNTASRLDAYLSVISLLVGLGVDPAPEAALLEDLRPVIDATLDMELTTRFDELQTFAGGDTDAYRRETLRFLQDAADFAAEVNAGGRPPG